MERSWANRATVAGFILALAIAVWQVASGVMRLESRIASLELQTSTWGTGVAISNSVATANQVSNAPDTLNPLWARCDDLAALASKAIEDGRVLTSLPALQDLMVQLRCDASRE